MYGELCPFYHSFSFSFFFFFFLLFVFFRNNNQSTVKQYRCVTNRVRNNFQDFVLAYLCIKIRLMRLANPDSWVDGRPSSRVNSTFQFKLPSSKTVYEISSVTRMGGTRCSYLGRHFYGARHFRPSVS